MTDVSLSDVWARRKRAENSDADICSWNPKRRGESVRKCPTCGAEFEPKSRFQKYCCKECRPSERKDK